MNFVPKAQEIYKHFKGNLYQIVSVAEHTETGELLVVYQAMYGDFKIYARPLEMFCSKVDREKYPNVKQEYRFELQTAWSAECGKQNEGTCGCATAENVRMAVGAETGTERGIPGNSLEETQSVGSGEVLQSETVAECMEEPEAELDPMLLAFLDAETYAEKLNILAGMHHRITDQMITTMAIASDIEIEEGDLENRYIQLKNCLQTLDRYEINRLH